LGCTGDADSASNSASCEFEDSYLGIHSYKSKDALDADVEQATSATSVLVGPSWYIDAPDAGTLEEAQAIVGGKIK
jgi:hypothetical protein